MSGVVCSVTGRTVKVHTECRKRSALCTRRVKIAQIRFDFWGEVGGMASPTFKYHWLFTRQPVGLLVHFCSICPQKTPTFKLPCQALFMVLSCKCLTGLRSSSARLQTDNSGLSMYKFLYFLHTFMRICCPRLSLMVA